MICLLHAYALLFKAGVLLLNRLEVVLTLPELFWQGAFLTGNGCEQYTSWTVRLSGIVLTVTACLSDPSFQRSRCCFLSVTVLLLNIPVSGSCFLLLTSTIWRSLCDLVTSGRLAAYANAETSRVVTGYLFVCTVFCLYQSSACPEFSSSTKRVKGQVGTCNIFYFSNAEFQCIKTCIFYFSILIIIRRHFFLISNF